VSIKTTALLLFLPSILFAQFNQWLPLNDSWHHSQAGISCEYYLDSKNLTNKFINTYRTGGFIDTEMKDKVLGRLDDNNTMGGDGTVQLYFRSAADSARNHGWFVGLSHTGVIDASFTKDLFHLYFYGNKPFAGKTADLGEMSYTNLEYQQLKAGLFKVHDKGANRAVYAFGVGYVNGQDYLDVQTDPSTLYTAVDATYLQMDLAMESRHADSANHAFGAFNGSGAALSLFYRFEKKDNYIITVQLQDAGFISWNSNTSYIRVDTNYYFDGVEVNNLLDSLYLEVKSVEDYKSSFLKENKKESATSMLPALAEVSVEKWLAKKRILAGVHVRYRFGTLQFPVIRARAAWYGSQQWYAAVIAQYGGYGGFHAGLEAGLHLGKQWMIAAGCQYLDAIFAGNSRAGEGGFVRAAFSF